MYHVCRFCSKPLLNLEPNTYDNRFLWGIYIYESMNVLHYKRDASIKKSHTPKKKNVSNPIKTFSYNLEWKSDSGKLTCCLVVRHSN